MQCAGLELTYHLLQRLFSRQISVAEVRFAVEHGQVIATYPDDKPYPSVLLLAFVNQTPLHVVVAHDTSTGLCVAVTAYRPDPLLWKDTFTQKIK